MTLLAVMVLVGAGSYLLRVLPLLLANRIRLSTRVERVLADAVLAALAALLATAVHRLVTGSLSPGLTPVAGYAALAVGAAVALRGGSIGRVALAGAATTAVVVATTTFV
jgi:branched-subunit amino acid transport protein